MNGQTSTGESASPRGPKRKIDIVEVKTEIQANYNGDEKKTKKPKYLQDNIDDPKVRNAIMSKRNRELKKQKQEDIVQENVVMKSEIEECTQELQRAYKKIAELELERAANQYGPVWVHPVNWQNVPQNPNYDSQSRIFFPYKTAMSQIDCATELRNLLSQLNAQYAPALPAQNNIQLYELSTQFTLMPVSSPLPEDLENLDHKDLLFSKMSSINTELYDY